MNNPDWPAIRALFPGARARPYLDVSVRGLLATPVRAAVDRHMDVRMYRGGEKEDLHAGVEAARAHFASLIGATPDEVAFTKNVSEGLNLFAASLPWRSGDRVVLCAELEHPNNVYLWYNLARRVGIDVREVAADDGRVPIDALVDAMGRDGRTRLVTVPSQTFAPGLRTDVRTLAAEARRRGALTLVDAAQSIGALDMDVHALGIDALTVATQKALLAFYGTGFLWIRRDLADTLVPVSLARYGVDLAGASETALGARDFQYASGARRFDLGNYNYLGITAADAAMTLIGGIGIPAIERRVTTLAARLAHGFDALGLPVAGGADAADRAHIVSLGRQLGDTHYAADDPALVRLHEHLAAHDVQHSIRRGVLRFSLALFNDENDVDRVLEWTEQFSRG